MADPHTAPSTEIMRSPLGRARGLGSAQRGSHEWWVQKLLSLALVPLTVWFVIAAIQLTGASYQQMVAWMHSPWRITLMCLLVAITFYHLTLGLQAVLEDYVHHELTRLAANILQKGLCLLLAIVCIVSTLKIGL
ncbi:MAG TPA: succinate dehydrogenase, hydrophobic membrane anchor protein [Rhodopila sp.]|nr:succinate dehydrogenase, hydrophobic membrane anchor protein [Rhodopila sp.]